VAEISNPRVGAKAGFPGTKVFDAIGVVAWTNLDLSAVVGANPALVFLKVINKSGGNANFQFRPEGDTDTWLTLAASGAATVQNNGVVGIVMTTNAAGILEWLVSVAAGTIEVYVLGWIRA